MRWFDVSSFDGIPIGHSENKNFISGGVPPVSHNALDRIIYAIFPPLFQVIQRCSVEAEGSHRDLFDLQVAQDLAVCRVFPNFMLL